jgi:hypothetical protein
MVFLTINTWCSKRVQDAKNWIKTLIWKVCICWFMLHNCITMQGKKKINNIYIFCCSIFSQNTYSHYHRTPVFRCFAEHSLGNDELFLTILPLSALWSLCHLFLNTAVAYRSLKKSSLVKLLVHGQSILQKLDVYICSSLVMVTKLQDGRPEKWCSVPAEADPLFWLPYPDKLWGPPSFLSYR